MYLYETTQAHKKNNERFREFMRRYSWVKWAQPNAEKAPWHVIGEIRGSGPYTEIINVWPHKAKASRNNGNAVKGWDEVRALMTEIIEADGFGELLE